MKKERKNNTDVEIPLLGKISLSLSINFILIIIISFLIYESKFSTGKKLINIRLCIVDAYLLAILAHIFISTRQPINRKIWIYIVITIIGMIPNVWYFVLTFILL